jgi:hypothetical protein
MPKTPFHSGFFPGVCGGIFYLRFVLEQIDERTGKFAGLFDTQDANRYKDRKDRKTPKTSINFKVFCMQLIDNYLIKISKLKNVPVCLSYKKCGMCNYSTGFQ